MNKMIAVVFSQEDNPNGKLVEVKYTDDGLNWMLAFACRVIPSDRHPYGDEIPNEYIHVDILNRIQHYISKGYTFIA